MSDRETQVVEPKDDVPAEQVEQPVHVGPPPPPAPSESKTRRGSLGFLVAVISAALIGGVTGGAIVKGTLGDSDDRTSLSQPRVGSGDPPARRATDAPPGTVAAIVEKIRPSVVAIETRAVPLDELLDPDAPVGGASGVVLDDKGHILTNAHVVEGAENIEVIGPDGERHQAKLVGRDRLTDLAVIKIEAALTPAPLGDSDQLRVGDGVIAVGNALNLEGGPTVTEGIVSALDRQIVTEATAMEDLIQTDAAINPGNSGGPLLNLSGEVVGINTAGAWGAQNIGFAIAITPSKPRIEDLINTGKVVRAFLGVQMEDVTPAVARRQNLEVQEGALVVRIIPNTGAAEAGMRVEDVIVEVDGKKVKNTDEVGDEIESHKPGERLNLVVVRGDDRVTINAVLGERPQ